jgi:hypothetical protein
VAPLKTHFDAGVRGYDRLYGHFALRNYGITGDAIVAFVGPCLVAGDDLVDLGDEQAGEKIVAAAMVHFIVEHFGVPLPEAVWRQRVLAAVVAEDVAARTGAARVRRRGDDVYVDEGKLTVSIATVSPTSALIHLGVNVDAAGAPVKTSDLNSLQIDAAEFAVAVMARYVEEVAAAAAARCKVRGVC